MHLLGRPRVAGASLLRHRGVRPRHRTLLPRAHSSDDRAALNEAVQLYRQAQELALEQARQELLQSWLSTAAALDSGDDGGQASTSALSEDTLAAFWLEQGLASVGAARLARDLLAPGDAPPPRSTAQLSDRLQALRRLLPGLDAPALVAREPRLLAAAADGGRIVAVLLALMRIFGDDGDAGGGDDAGRGRSSIDVLGVVERQPRLLLEDAAELAERAPRVLAHLARLHPSRDFGVVREIVAENPELLWRMDYYPNATLLDELPVEVQNMLVLADMGLGHLHRFWRQKRRDAKRAGGSGRGGGSGGGASAAPDEWPAAGAGD